jgi:hypothetical protein
MLEPLLLNCIPKARQADDGYLTAVSTDLIEGNAQ